MLETARMAGFFAAHGIWCVADGETLIPLLGYEHTDGERGMERLMHDDIADGARAGQEALEDGQPSWVSAVLVADAYIHLDHGKTDALIVEAVRYGPIRQTMSVAVPYRPLQDPRGFAVHRPKFLDTECSDLGPLAEAFFLGVQSHEEAAAVWDAYLDESI